MTEPPTLQHELATNRDALLRLATTLAQDVRTQPAGQALGAYRQVTIKRFESCRCHGDERIVLAVLRCGHRVAYQKTRPATSKRTSMPCYACGAILRSRADRDRQRRRMRWRIGAAACSEDKAEALARLLGDVLLVLATPPVTDMQRSAWERMDRAANVLELRTVPEYESV